MVAFNTNLRRERERREYSRTLSKDLQFNYSIEQVLEFMREKRTLIFNILSRKATCIDHILRRNYFLHDVIERQMKEVKGVGRRITQIRDDFEKQKKILGAKGGRWRSKNMVKHFISRTKRNKSYFP